MPGNAPLPVKKISCLFFVCFLYGTSVFSQDSTYAEKLGFPKGKKVVIFHVDDVGMSLDGNHGAIEAMEKGVKVPPRQRPRGGARGDGLRSVPSAAERSPAGREGRSC